MDPSDMFCFDMICSVLDMLWFCSEYVLNSVLVIQALLWQFRVPGGIIGPMDPFYMLDSVMFWYVQISFVMFRHIMFCSVKSCSVLFCICAVCSVLFLGPNQVVSGVCEYVVWTLTQVVSENVNMWLCELLWICVSILCAAFVYALFLNAVSDYENMFCSDMFRYVLIISVSFCYVLFW